MIDISSSLYSSVFQGLVPIDCCEFGDEIQGQGEQGWHTPHSGRKLGHVRGKDEDGRRLRGYGVNLGGTCRFANLPLHPSISLGYAYGSGDDENDASFRKAVPGFSVVAKAFF
jgi:hypothetical protein